MTSINAYKKSPATPKLEKIIKILLSISLFLCVLKMPYGFYQLVRLLAMVGFTILAHVASVKQEKVKQIIFISLAILFQPLVKISLGRTTWNIVDVFVGIGLIITIFIENDR